MMSIERYQELQCKHPVTTALNVGGLTGLLVFVILFAFPSIPIFFTGLISGLVFTALFLMSYGYCNKTVGWLTTRERMYVLLLRRKFQLQQRDQTGLVAATLAEVEAQLAVLEEEMRVELEQNRLIDTQAVTQALTEVEQVNAGLQELKPKNSYPIPSGWRSKVKALLGKQ